MAADQIKFEDGAGYEKMMGSWSRLVGDRFLDWLEPAPAGRWLDVGCGNGAFTAQIGERCAPAEVVGIDPAPPQLAYARQRPDASGIAFLQGDAMALPFEDGRFDSAVGALVIFFMPDPAKGVAEMARVIRPGGSASTYAWDLLGGGFPYEAVQAQMLAVGLTPLTAPRAEAAELGELERLWTAAGLAEIETTAITVEREFPSFDTFWSVTVMVPGIGPVLAKLPQEDVARLRDRVRDSLPALPDGRVRVSARAHAVKGVRG